jgi:hypothetical protein
MSGCPSAVRQGDSFECLVLFPVSQPEPREKVRCLRIPFEKPLSIRIRHPRKKEASTIQFLRGRVAACGRDLALLSLLRRSFVSGALLSGLGIADTYLVWHFSAPLGLLLSHELLQGVYRLIVPPQIFALLFAGTLARKAVYGFAVLFVEVNLIYVRGESGKMSASGSSFLNDIIFT